MELNCKSIFPVNVMHWTGWCIPQWRDRDNIQYSTNSSQMFWPYLISGISGHVAILKFIPSIVYRQVNTNTLKVKSKCNTGCNGSLWFKGIFKPMSCCRKNKRKDEFYDHFPLRWQRAPELSWVNSLRDLGSVVNLVEGVYPCLLLGPDTN